jgi:phosphinothricin acetyltransferase
MPPVWIRRHHIRVAQRREGQQRLRMTLIIRDSIDADLPAITAIYGHAVRTGTASFEYDPPDVAEMARRRAEILAKTYPYLVAELDGAVAGYAYANTYRTRPAYRFSVEDSIYLAPDRQGAGLGRQLLPALLQRCEALDLRLVIAVIGDQATLPSIRLHASCGFTHAGSLPNVGWKHGRWLDSVFMVRALGPGPDTPPRQEGA